MGIRIWPEPQGDPPPPLDFQLLCIFGFKGQRQLSSYKFVCCSSNSKWSVQQQNVQFYDVFPKFWCWRKCRSFELWHGRISGCGRRKSRSGFGIFMFVNYSWTHQLCSQSFFKVLWQIKVLINRKYESFTLPYFFSLVIETYHFVATKKYTIISDIVPSKFWFGRSNYRQTCVQQPPLGP